MSLKDKLRMYDYESFEESPVVEVTKEELELANEARLEAIATEKEVEDAVEVLEEVSKTVIDLQEEITETLEVIDELSPVEIGKVLGSIETKAEKILDEAEMPKIDQEAWDSDYRTAARVDLEGIADALKDKVLSFTNMFRTTEGIMVKAADVAKTRWVTGNESRIQDSLNTLKDVKESDEVKNIKIGEKLAAVRLLKLTPKDLEDFAKGLGTIDPKTSGVSKTDKAALGYVKTVKKLSDGSKLIVSRIDGTNTSSIITGKHKESGLDVFIGYYNDKVTPRSLDILKSDGFSETSLDYAKQLLNSAKVINGNLSAVSNNIVEELKTLKAMLAGDMKDAKWRAGGFMKNGGWATLATLLLIGTASFIPAARVGVKKAVELDDLEVLVNAVKIPVSTAAAGITAAFLSRKSFEQLSAGDRLKVLRARVDLTTKYSKDILYGLNSLVNEMVDVANAIIRAHSKAKAK